MRAQYWIRNGSAVTGPYDQLQIRGLVAMGQLTPLMELSNDGKRWLPARSIKGLFASKVADNPGAHCNVASEMRNADHANGANAVVVPEYLPAARPTRPPLHKSRAGKAAMMIGGLVVASSFLYTQFLKSGTDYGCSNNQVEDLATSIIYEDMAKRSQPIQIAAATGAKVTSADLKKVEQMFRNAVKLNLAAVSTIGGSQSVTRCKAILHMAMTPAGEKSGLTYFGEAYADGESISYSVRDSDDGNNFYVRIPAE